jgi:hypothetical protein
LLTAEVVGRSKLIPIWYQIDFPTVAKVSPLLADRLAISGKLEVEIIAAKIAEQFPVPAKISGDKLAELIENHYYPGMYEGEALLKGCEERFFRMNAFKEEYNQLLYGEFDKLADTEEFSDELEERFKVEEERLRLKFEIAKDVYLTTDEPVRESGLRSWIVAISRWVSGTLTREESAELILDIDLEELDEYFILLNVPNFSISKEQRPLLHTALIELGCGFNNEYKKLTIICKKLRALDSSSAW